MTALLCEAVKGQLELTWPEEDGTCLLDHLQQAQAWERIEEISGPAVPSEILYLWGWFWELNRARGSTGFGPGILDWTALKHWMEITGNRLTSWEVATLRAVDDIYLEFVAKRAKPKGTTHGR